MHTKKIGSFFLPHGVEHRCKNVRFLFWSRFYVFKSFILDVFLFLKNVGKVQNLKFNEFINNRILYPIIRV